jgi:hypothetical protein
VQEMSNLMNGMVSSSKCRSTYSTRLESLMKYSFRISIDQPSQPRKKWRRWRLVRMNWRKTQHRWRLARKNWRKTLMTWRLAKKNWRKKWGPRLMKSRKCYPLFSRINSCNENYRRLSQWL